MRFLVRRIPNHPISSCVGLWSDLEHGATSYGAGGFPAIEGGPIQVPFLVEDQNCSRLIPRQQATAVARFEKFD